MTEQEISYKAQNLAFKLADMTRSECLEDGSILILSALREASSIVSRTLTNDE